METSGSQLTAVPDNRDTDSGMTPVASFTKEVNQWLAKCPLVFNVHLANRGLTSFVKEATGTHFTSMD